VVRYDSPVPVLCPLRGGVTWKPICQALVMLIWDPCVAASGNWVSEPWLANQVLSCVGLHRL
jgi:hypothetical protein